LDRASGSTSTWDRSSCSGDLFWSCVGLQNERGGIRPELTYDSELAREKMWARIHLIPALQAEEDRDQVRRYLADKAREKELLGTETRVYHSDRCVSCAIAILESTVNTTIGLCARHSPLHPRTRRSREWRMDRRECVGYDCTYTSRTKLRGTGALDGCTA
jgi:hypothetical protein